MADTLTAPATPGPSGTPTSTPSTLAEVSPSLAEQLYSTPPVEPTTQPAPVEATETKPADTPANEATTDAPEYIQGDDGRWRRADGTFATADELTQIEAQLTETEKAKADEDANRPTTVAKLRDRSGNIIEVETGDEQLAQLINQNTNDGMRRREYVEKVADVDAKLAHLTHIDATLQESPETFVYQSLTDEQRINLGVMLLARDFDKLIPVINAYATDPSQRIEETARATQRVKEAEERITATAEARGRAAEVRKAVFSLIPEDAREEDAGEFVTLASSLLSRAIESGQVVDATTAPKIIGSLAAKYGFSSAAPAAPSRPRITLAKPSTTPLATAPTAGTASPQNQQRLRLVTQRRNAAAIPPKGRSGPAAPALAPHDRAFQDAAHLLYGNTTRAS